MTENKKQILASIQLKMDALMARLEKEFLNDNYYFDHLETCAVLLTGFTMYERRNMEKLELKVDTYSADHGYLEHSIISTSDEELADNVYGSLKKALNNSGLQGCTDGTYWLD